MAERWDWRQSYARYSDMQEGQDQQKSAPQGREAPTPSPAPSGAPQGDVQPPGSGRSHYAAYPLPATNQGCRAFSIAAFFCGGLALLLLPFVLGPLGITLGFVGQSRGDRLGKWAGLMSIATTLLGIAFRIWMARNVGVDFGD